MGIVGHCSRLQFPVQAAGVVKAMLTLLGHMSGVFGGLGAGVQVPGECWARHISLELLHIHTCNVWFT